MDRLYKQFSTSGKFKQKFLSKDDAVEMMEQADVPASEEKIVIAYALSK